MTEIRDILVLGFLLIFTFFLLFHFLSFCYFGYRSLKRKVQQSILKRFMKKEGILYVSDYHEKFLLRKLKRCDYFINFLEVTEESEQGKRENYLRNLKDVFVSLIPRYQKKKMGFQIYFMSFLAKYPMIYESDWNSIIKYIIDSCASKSIYLRENALKALYKLGQENYLKEALRQMNYLNLAHPTKLLSDGFLSYQGNIDSFIAMLKENIFTYNENYKIACIEYFSYHKVDFKNGIFKLLSSAEESKEVKLSCIRYFANAIYEPVTKILYLLLKEDTTNFEYAAVAANVLKSYPSKETFHHLSEALRSPNWFVRNNAAKSLVSFASTSELEKLKRIDDTYGREAILYQIASLEKEVS